MSIPFRALLPGAACYPMLDPGTVFNSSYTIVHAAMAQRFCRGLGSACTREGKPIGLKQSYRVNNRRLQAELAPGGYPPEWVEGPLS